MGFKDAQEWTILSTCPAIPRGPGVTAGGHRKGLESKKGKGGSYTIYNSHFWRKRSTVVRGEFISPGYQRVWQHSVWSTKDTQAPEAIMYHPKSSNCSLARYNDYHRRSKDVPQCARIRRQESKNHFTQSKFCVYEIGVDLETVFFGLLYLTVETVGLLKSFFAILHSSGRQVMRLPCY